MAGFQFRRTEAGQTAGELREFIIANSQTITIGDMVTVTSGFATLALAGNRIVGCVIGLKKDLGNGNTVPLGLDAAGTISGIRSGNAGVVGSDTVAAASNNQTVDKVVAVLNVDQLAEYYNDASGDLTTAELGKYFDIVAASDQIDQSTATNTYSAQMVCTRLNPDGDNDLSKGIFRIVEHSWTA